MMQLDGLMQSPLYSTMFGGQKYPCTYCMGQRPRGGDDTCWFEGASQIYMRGLAKDT